MENQVNIFIDSFKALSAQFASFIPQLLAAMILFVVGWILAKIIRNAFNKALLLLRFDDLSQKSGVDAFLHQGKIQTPLSGLLSSLVYWLVLLVVIVFVANSLGLTAVAGLFNRVVFYLPNIFIAVLVIVFGALIARFLNRLIFAYLTNLGVSGALTLSTMAEYAVLIFVLLVALEQLQIGTHLILVAFQIAFGAVGLALALAFGLGGKEWAAGIIERLTEKNR